MEDVSDEGMALKQIIAEEVNKCTDPILLDLIYKILISGT